MAAPSPGLDSMPDRQLGAPSDGIGLGGREFFDRRYRVLRPAMLRDFMEVANRFGTAKAEGVGASSGHDWTGRVVSNGTTPG
jgi:hypothetical protein